MTYNKELAEKVEKALGAQKGISARKMFGGMCFLLNGNMCVGVLNDDLVIRCGADAQSKLLDKPYTRPMDFTGKPMKSMIYISPSGWKKNADLKEWIKHGIAFVKTLPKKY